MDYMDSLEALRSQPDMVGISVEIRDARPKLSESYVQSRV